jgi:hypothetical protein
MPIESGARQDATIEITRQDIINGLASQTARSAQKPSGIFEGKITWSHILTFVGMLVTALTAVLIPIFTAISSIDKRVTIIETVYVQRLDRMEKQLEQILTLQQQMAREHAGYDIALKGSMRKQSPHDDH